MSQISRHGLAPVTFAYTVDGKHFRISKDVSLDYADAYSEESRGWV